ncbi:uncharacterized protein LOC129587181 [Paramacrobiotus metropolitanus]|uniref:uncharacterized protein LOC129587181 n=1 Tax=Paramacrobiotus metropolitanus TaxID=2943436 RepID=UPI0024460613|nr:uncharacterized protein LOC129587181 [Paramacrobiotus metropolitanus]
MPKQPAHFSPGYIACYLTNKTWRRAIVVTYLVTTSFIQALFRIAILGIFTLGCFEACYVYSSADPHDTRRHHIPEDSIIILLGPLCFYPGIILFLATVRSLKQSWQLLLGVNSFRQSCIPIGIRGFTNSSAHWQKICTDLRSSLELAKVFKNGIALSVLILLATSYILEWWDRNVFHFEALRRMWIILLMEALTEYLDRCMAREAESLELEIIASWFQQRTDQISTKNRVAKNYAVLLQELTSSVEAFKDISV